ncbi:hypothetical protein GQ53DRAFT_42454 [Thozetella sp. PMI_491]|nr:hypothetical protein GQ53DRAFT_42454 [Thozetella sp. PMI_491]
MCSPGERVLAWSRATGSRDPVKGGGQRGKLLLHLQLGGSPVHSRRRHTELIPTPLFRLPGPPDREREIRLAPSCKIAWSGGTCKQSSQRLPMNERGPSQTRRKGSAREHLRSSFRCTMTSPCFDPQGLRGGWVTRRGGVGLTVRFTHSRTVSGVC